MGFFFSFFFFFFFFFFFKYETIVSRYGLSLGYSERDTSSVSQDVDSEFEDNIPLTAQNILIDKMEKRNDLNQENSEPQIICRNVIRYEDKLKVEEIFIDKANEEYQVEKKSGGTRSSLKKVIILA